MKRRKLVKRVKLLERKVDELQQARMWEPLGPARVDGPELDPHALLRECVADWMHGYDPHALLRECVADWMHGYDDDEDWSSRGYL